MLDSWGQQPKRMGTVQRVSAVAGCLTHTASCEQSPAVYVIVKLLSLHTTMFEAVYSCVLPLGILKGCNQVAVVSGFFRLRLQPDSIR